MSGICEVIIYTNSSAVAFNIEATTEDFQDRLASALENGTVILDTAEGSKLILNAINVVAIEIHTADENTRVIPPIKKI